MSTSVHTHVGLRAKPASQAVRRVDMLQSLGRTVFLKQWLWRCSRVGKSGMLSYPSPCRWSLVPDYLQAGNRVLRIWRTPKPWPPTSPVNATPLHRPQPISSINEPLPLRTLTMEGGDESTSNPQDGKSTIEKRKAVGSRRTLAEKLGRPSSTSLREKPKKGSSMKKVRLF